MTFYIIFINLYPKQFIRKAQVVEDGKEGCQEFLKRGIYLKDLDEQVAWTGRKVIGI